jgi:hypothetical protein
VAAGAAGVGAGATGFSSLGSALNGSSFKGPLVALMPAAGLDAGSSGMSTGAGFDGAAASVVVVLGTSAGFVAALVGASVEDVGAEAAVGGTGAVAPTGSGAENRNR